MLSNDKQTVAWRILKGCHQASNSTQIKILSDADQYVAEVSYKWQTSQNLALTPDIQFPFDLTQIRKMMLSLLSASGRGSRSNRTGVFEGSATHLLFGIECLLLADLRPSATYLGIILV